MDVRTSASVRHEPEVFGDPRAGHSYPAPMLWPRSNTLRVGAAVLIAVVLGVVIVLAVRPWDSSSPSYDDNYNYNNPYGQGAAVHGGLR
ncbi:hypothetical protein ABIA35_002174 [Catenulispora sp. MAP12-49]|uniref:hypothetical protein n=1 Tax=unclassified Catenulispora TaxID=414885 RepID=UPI00351409A6